MVKLASRAPDQKLPPRPGLPILAADRSERFPAPARLARLPTARDWADPAAGRAAPREAVQRDSLLSMAQRQAFQPRAIARSGGAQRAPADVVFEVGK